MKHSQIQFVFNPENEKRDPLAGITAKELKTIRNFHQSFTEYTNTPLHTLENLAQELGVEKIWVKDESYRFGLNAFKVLGASFALGKYLAEQIGLPMEELTFETLSSPKIKKQLGDITFVTATDGNHGRGVAWAAEQLGQKSVVFMPKGASATRLENIKKEGAQAFITEVNYDDTVRYAREYAEKNKGVMVQDTAWPGYETIPLWIMQGYTTIIGEALEQIASLGHGTPTHVFLQAGVGSFAGSILGYFVSTFGKDRPKTIIMEPENAACIYKSALANDGEAKTVDGDLATIMSGLSCGEPNTISWELLRDYADMYVSCPDYVAAKGVRMLASPLKGDPQVISGESGAVGMGLVSLITEGTGKLGEMKELLKIDENARILLISTEGDTDPEDYRKIVWDGAFPS